MKKLFSVLLAVCLLAGTFAGSAAAEDLASGYGWTLSAAGELRVSLYEIPDSFPEYSNHASGSEYDIIERQSSTPWEAYKDRIKTVVLESPVKKIGAYAFSDCVNLTGVEMPVELNSIGACAFSGCTSLTEISIPAGVTEISSCAFSSCKNLTSVVLPKGIKTIGGSAFSGCEFLQAISLPGSVTVIDSGAFRDCAALQSIRIPDGVTEISSSTFRGCRALTGIEIPDGVTRIASWAFADCISLSRITLPAKLKTIEYEAFGGCAALSGISIPAAVTSISVGAFHNCSSLCGISVDAKNSVYSSAGNCVIVTAENKLLLGCRNSVIPDTVSTIGPEAFADVPITSVKIPSGVREINPQAFKNCAALKSLTFASGVTNIWQEAFAGCASLTALSLPKSVTNIDARAFQDCSSLTDLAIPEGVKKIGNYAFSGCKNLESVSLPESLTSMNANAFSGCTALNALTVAAKNPSFSSGGNCIIKNSGQVLLIGCKTSVIPSYVKTIGDSAFAGCTGLTKATIPEGVTEIKYGAFANCTGLKELTIPASVSVIGSQAFQGCTALTNVTIPEGVTDVKYGAFEGCANLMFVSIPSGVTGIASNTFAGCTRLTGVTVPAGVTSIGKEAFANCAGMIDVWLPDSLTQIGDSAFSGCASLQTFRIPAGVTGISSSAFDGCDLTFEVAEENETYRAEGNCLIETQTKTLVKGFAESEIPADGKVTAIGDNAFKNCAGLTDVTIPTGVTAIGNSAFQGCTGLTAVTIPAGVTAIGSSAFRDCAGLTDVTIPAGVKSIGSSAFQGCVSLMSVTIPAGVENIAGSLFAGCSELRSVTIQKGPSYIGGYAFADCRNLTTLTLPQDVTSILQHAFLRCTSLTEIVFAEGLQQLGWYVFEDCAALEKITFPRSLTEIEYSVCLGCQALKDVYFLGTQEEWDAVFIWGDGNARLENAALHCLGSVLPTSGVCGENLTWEMDGNVLTITGTGDMYDYAEGESPFSNRDDIHDVFLEDAGITGVGDRAFFNCRKLMNVTLGKDVTRIGTDAFSGCEILDFVCYAGNAQNWTQDITFFPGNASLTSAYLKYSDKTQLFVDGYDFSRDSYSFINNFDVPVIDRSYFDVMFHPGPGKTLDAFYNENKDKADGGVCFGMAYTTAAILCGVPAVTDMASSRANANLGLFHSRIRDLSVKSVFGVVGDDGSKTVFNLGNYILYSHIYQNSAEQSANQRQFTDVGNSFVRRDLQNFFRYVKTQLLDQNRFVTISLKCFHVTDGDPLTEENYEGGHRVLAVGIEGNDILIDDPNNKDGLERLHIIDGCAGWTYSGGWHSAHYSQLNESNTILSVSSDYTAPYRVLQTGVQLTPNTETEDPDQIGGTQKLSADKLLVYTTGDGYRLGNQDAAEIYPEDGPGAKKTGRLYWIGPEKTVTATNETGAEGSITVAGNRTVVTADGTGPADEIAVTVDEAAGKIGAELSGTAGRTYSLTLADADEDPAKDTGITVSGVAANGAVRAEKTADGLTVTGLNDITIVYAEADETVGQTTAAVTDGRTVKITVNAAQDAVTTDFTVPGEDPGAEDPTEPATDPEPQPEPQPETGNRCRYCGKVHTGFFGKITAFFHNIFYFFAHLFGRR